MSKFNGGKSNIGISILKNYKFYQIDPKIDLPDLLNVGYFYIIQNPIFVATHPIINKYIII
jgi:hypothetical protein